MRKMLKTMALAIMLAGAGALASAQTPPQRQDLPPVRDRLPPAPKLNLTMEQRHTIVEFIKDQKSEATTRDVTATIGDAIPQDINPQPMPAIVGQKVPQVKAHRYFVTGQEIVIVDPKDDKVADVIKLTND